MSLPSNRKTILIAMLLAALLGFAQGPLHARLPFVDDFDDGDIADGSPASWLLGTFQNGTAEVVDQSYVLSGTAVSSYPDTGSQPRDVSIQTQLRFLEVTPDPGSQDAAYLFARSPTAAAYFGGIFRNGLLAIGEAFDDASFEIRSTLETQLDPLANDVLLEFEVRGETISLTAWEEGDTIPDAPQLVMTDDTLTFGGVGVGILSGSPTVPIEVAFRSFSAVPEPSGRVFGCVGLACIGGFLVLNRRSRANALVRRSADTK